MQRLPKVSVLTPSLNYARYLTDAIESVARQADVEVEHVVQDGGSTDGTLDLLRATPSRISWASAPDEGQSDALNKALARARGEWIAWLNADEFYLPGALRALIDAATEDQSDVVYGDTAFVDDHGSLLRLMSHHPFRDRYLRWYGCYFASCSTIFRREVLNDSPWDRAYGLAMDWDLYLRLHKAGARISYVRYPAGAFRMHSAQVIAREHDFVRDFKALEADHHVRSRGLRRLGRWLHDVDKLRHGAYRPQLRARAFEGHDMRWFRSPEGLAEARRFIRSCYGITDPKNAVHPWARESDT